MITVKFRRIATPQGRIPPLPQHATAGSAGADLYANIDAPLAIEPMGRTVIPTGLAMELPHTGYGAFIFARSGLGIRHGLTLPNGVGVIDSDYRGEMSVGLVNLSDQPYTVQPGERIAQLCIIPITQFTATETACLTQTERGAGGFGSTGQYEGGKE